MNTSGEQLQTLRRVLSPSRLIRVLAFLGLWGGPAWGQEIPPPGGPVVSVRQVWSGNDPVVAVKELALRVAPILWFSAEEPLFQAGLQGPTYLPTDTVTTEKVVYYRRVRSLSPIFGLPLTSSDPELTLDTPVLYLQYLFYYQQDYGGGCHSNDLESAFMTLELRDRGDGKSPRYVVSLDRVIGAAHGSTFYNNILQLPPFDGNDLLVKSGGGASLPITLFVEEGKHAVAPDRNADGQYTPGYDVNTHTNDAWGIRDVFGSSYLGPSAYSGPMTKLRHGAWRFRAKTIPIQTAWWATSYRSTWWPELPSQTYDLRELPPKYADFKDTDEPQPNLGCKARRVDYFLKQSGIQTTTPSPLGRMLKMYATTFKGFRLGYETTPDSTTDRARLGFTTTLPVFTVPLVDGDLSLKQTFMFVGVPRKGYKFDFSENMAWDFQVMYTPSLSRRFEWYAGGGPGFLIPTSPSTPDLIKFNPVLEAGIQIRWLPKIVASIGVKTSKREGPRFWFEIGRQGMAFTP